MTDTPVTESHPDNQLSDWEAKDAAHDHLRQEQRSTNKSTLFDTLAAAGITHVLVDFDGYADSGQIEKVEFKTGDVTVPMPENQIEIAYAKWGNSEPEKLTVSLDEVAGELAYDFLEQTHDGWENDEGAYGRFTFNVAERTISLAYNERYIESEYSEHVF